MATDELEPGRIDSLAADLFELVRGCADLTFDVTARIVRALLVAGYREGRSVAPDVGAALQEFCETFADDMVIEGVAEHLSCLEADPLANLLEATGYSRAAAGWRELHTCIDQVDRPATDAEGIRRGEGQPEPAGLQRGPDAQLGGDPAATDPGGEERPRRPGLRPDGPRRIRRERSGDSAEPADPDGDPGAVRGERLGSADAAGSLFEVDAAIDAHGFDGFGDYTDAVRRWESLTRTAPPPLQGNGPRYHKRIAPRFVEWMMGLPEGWVTGVPGLAREDMLSMLGDGVVPQQAAAALRHLLPLVGAQ